ncbi:hypothetical protein OOT33_14680 [Sphingobium sp. DEHP117]|uniref:hypothetical protein n=1 Tax=Sphingobium sp. DEHP117 TaxID=2993436 RepID=UPI0027D4879E|nr:hypothetical protein [Sphingobium sp. DEHP117]MDQ4421671.1 hypothetical protein [Sphingobium sp. DEHP117]
MIDMDFNSADTQDSAFALIPANTLVRIHLTIRPGGAGPEGWLTQSKSSSALYLNTEGVIEEGPHARRRIYTRIGFRGRNADTGAEDTYANRGRALLRGILESAHGVRSDDTSDQARAKRTIRSFGDMSGLTFIAKIGIERDKNDPSDQGRNVIVAAIGPQHPEYAALMGTTPGAYAPAASAPAMAPSNGGAPFWAQ